MRNIDKVKAMNIDEMAKFLARSECTLCTFNAKDINCNELDCKDGIKQWLEQESEEE